jgi:hypothetical protein
VPDFRKLFGELVRAGERRLWRVVAVLLGIGVLLMFLAQFHQPGMLLLDKPLIFSRISRINLDFPCNPQTLAETNLLYLASQHVLWMVQWFYSV